MKLRRLDVARVPGVEQPFALDAPDPGLNVLVGPNGVGKSRLCAAVRALLWDDHGVMEGKLAASALFEHEGVSWRVERDGSHVRWQRDGEDSAAPPLPGERLAGCFFLGLADLLDASDRAGRDLAGEIRLQMSGGFDLDAVQQELTAGVSARSGKREEKRVSEVDTAIRKAAGEQRHIEESEQELASLEADAAQALQALSRITAIGMALQLADLREDLAAQESEWNQLPAELSQLDGQEAASWEKLDADTAKASVQRDEARQLVARAQAAAAETGLSEPIGARVLDEWLARAETLLELERRCLEARDRATSARSRLVVARKTLGRNSDEELVEPGFTLDEGAELFALLSKTQKHEAESVAVRERLQVLSAHTFDAASVQRLSMIERAVDPLRDWLRTPEVVAAAATQEARPWPTRQAWLLAGAALAVLGGGWAVLDSAPAVAWVMLGAGLALMVAGWLSRLRAESTAPEPVPATDLRAVVQQRYPTGVEPPAGWTPEEVREHLASLEAELSSLLAERRLDEYRKVDRAALEASLEGLASRAAALDESRRALATQLGLDQLKPDAEMVDTARALDEARRTQLEARDAHVAWEAVDAERTRLLETLGAFLVAHGESQPVDGAAARAAIRSLQAREQELVKATGDQARGEQDRARLDQRLAELHDAGTALFERAGLPRGDLAGLSLLLARRPRYLELATGLDGLRAQVRALEDQLTRAGESALADWEVPRLTDEKAALDVQSTQLEPLNQRIGGIREQIRTAREGHVLEEALSQRDEALAELRDRRDEMLHAEAGSFLLDRVRHEHETHQMPAVLERARERFATFTHHRYQLKVSAEDGGAFVAVDQRTGEGLGLDKLSDGTRAQLVLAARLAFADEVEQEGDLPLFLDEALDHSDPDRFHAIACSLARMVTDEGRQVFYLSNDPTDAQRFVDAFREEGCAPPRITDLGALLGAAARTDGPGALQVEPLARVPDPVGRTAEDYGDLLGVPVLEPGRGAAAQHVYYLLRDDLSLLHRLLELRIRTAGPCRAFLQADTATAREVSSSSAARTGPQLEARIDLLESFCLAWAEGRGKPVDRAAIEDSDAVTATFLEAVVQASAELGGDARRLLEELRTPKPRGEPLSGFRSGAADKLETYFVEQGHMDDRPELSEEQILARLLITPAAQRLTPSVATDLVHTWWTLAERAG